MIVAILIFLIKIILIIIGLIFSIAFIALGLGIILFISRLVSFIFEIKI